MIAISVIAYILSTSAFVLYERRIHGGGKRLAGAAYAGLVFLIVGAAAQVVDFISIVRLGHSPFTQLQTSLSGFAICFVTLGIIFILGMKSWLLGIVIAPLGLVTAIVAMAYPMRTAAPTESLYEMSSLGLAVHAVLGYAGYAAFFTATIGGALFLLQDHQLRRKHLGLLFESLPSLERSSRLMAVGVSAGICLLVATFLVAGASLQEPVPARDVWSDPNVRTMALSLLYAAIVFGFGAKGGWSKHRTAALSVALGILVIAFRIAFASEIGLHGIVRSMP